ncbi:MAG: RNA 2',3'-cyclic phosphodiesterase [Acidobacteriota bacterium]
MRLFIAAEISPETRREIERLRDAASAGLGRFGRAPRIRWVKPEQAHVTLRFLGEVGARVLPAVCAAIERPFVLPPGEVCWARIIVLPTVRAPRVIALGATRGEEFLSELASQVAARLESIPELLESGRGHSGPAAGHSPARPFKPHITLGRIKEPGRRVDWGELLGAVQPAASVSWVERVVLMQSELSREGPTYTAIGTGRLVSAVEHSDRSGRE